MTIQKTNSSTFILWLTGMLSAFGPFVTDFYLPALPELGTYFATSVSMTQLSLTFGMIGLGVGQLFIGPLSDRLGRKPLLVASLLLFLVATIACLLTTNIRLFLVYRLVQGLAGAGGVVIARAIATDLYSGDRLARYFSMLSVVQGLAPILAPVLGGLLLAVTDWRGIFSVLLGFGLFLLLMLLRFRETLSPTASDSRPGLLSVFKTYVPVMRNRIFLRNTLIQALAMGVMFTYIASSPFIFQEHYRLSPVLYSLCFGINAFGIMAGSLLVPRFRGPERALRFGTRCFFAMSLVVAALLVVNAHVLLVESAFFLMLNCLGLIIPTTTALAMEPMRRNSGSASAVLGFLGFFVGGICSPLAGLGNMLHTTSMLIVLCAAGSLLLTFHKATKEKRNTHSPQF